MTVTHVSADGELLWSKDPLPGPDDYRGTIETIEIADGGDLLIGGLYIELSKPPPRDSDLWVARLDPTGELVWSTVLDGGEGGDDHLRDVAITDEGDILMTGSVGTDVVVVPDEFLDKVIESQTGVLWFGRADSSGVLIESTTLTSLPNSGGNRIALHPEHVLVAGGSGSQEPCGVALAVASFTYEGALNWWSGTSQPLPSVRAIEVVDDGTPTGALYLAGGRVPAWVGRFNSQP
jgi:hypothetical protein